MAIYLLLALIFIALCSLGIYYLLRSLGNDGVEAAAPGSCRSGRCGVTPRPRTVVGEVAASDLRRLRQDDATTADATPIDPITRADARSPNQTL